MLGHKLGPGWWQTDGKLLRCKQHAQIAAHERAMSTGSTPCYLADPSCC